MRVRVYPRTCASARGMLRACNRGVHRPAYNVMSRDFLSFGMYAGWLNIPLAASRECTLSTLVLQLCVSYYEREHPSLSLFDEN